MKEKDLKVNKNLCADWGKLGVTRQNKKQRSLPRGIAMHWHQLLQSVPSSHALILVFCLETTSGWERSWAANRWRLSEYSGFLTVGFPVFLLFSKHLVLVFPPPHHKQMLGFWMLVHILLSPPQIARGKELGDDPRRQVLGPGEISTVRRRWVEGCHKAGGGLWGHQLKGQHKFAISPEN